VAEGLSSEEVEEVEEEEEEVEVEVEVEESEVVEVFEEVFDFFPFCPLDLEVVEVIVDDTDVEMVTVTVGCSVMVIVTVSVLLSSPEGEAVGRLLSSDVLLGLSSTLVGDELVPEVGSSLPLSGWASRLATTVEVAVTLSSVVVNALPSVMVGKEESSVRVGVATSSVVRVTPATKPEPAGKRPVGKIPVGIPMPVPKSVLVESPVGYGALVEQSLSSGLPDWCGRPVLGWSSISVLLFLPSLGSAKAEERAK